MAKLDALTNAFDEGAENSSDADQGDVVRRSMIIINTVEKLKSQGIKITKKAEMDYLLAQRMVARASKMAGKDLMHEYREIHGEINHDPVTQTQDPASQSHSQKMIKRNPKDHPEEFKKAMEYSRLVVTEVELLQQSGKEIPVKKMEEYLLCKRFMDKFAK